jgi:transposase
MIKGEQQRIYHKGSNRKINAFITLLYPSNKIKFKISKSRTSADFVSHLKNVGNYIKKNKIKRFILVTDNATFHVSRKTKQFIENQLHWLTVIFLPKRSPNLNPVETRVNRNLKKDVCANHNYGTEENLTNAMRRVIGSWPKL